jgi:hypothetical protein
MTSRIRIKEFLNILENNLGYSSCILDLDFFPIPNLDPGVKKEPDHGSGAAAHCFPFIKINKLEEDQKPVLQIYEIFVWIGMRIHTSD